MISDTSIKEQKNTKVQTIGKKICKLPPRYLIFGKILTSNQKAQWIQKQRYWGWMGAKIDHLQGFCTDPFESCEMHEAVKIYLERIATTHFARLELMIAGWKIIKLEASKRNIDFPFQSPRQLFIEYCLVEATDNCKNFLAEGEGEDTTLTETREYYQDLKQTFTGTTKDTEQHKKKLEHFASSNDWFWFSVASFWDYRNQSKTRLSQKWREFLLRFNDESEMFLDEKFFSKYGAKLEGLKWCDGVCASTATSKIINLTIP